jgi:hypothetical protein
MAPAVAGALAIALVAAAASSLALADPSHDALLLQAFRNGLQDPGGALGSWDPELVDPCTWLHITCDGNNRVIRM